MSSRELVKSMAIIGGAQIAKIAISILRMKLLALMVGPTGFGLLSIYNNLLGMVSSLAGLGIGSSGVRQIAESRAEELALSKVRRVLLLTLLMQGFLAMIATWLLRSQIAELLFGDASYSTEVALIGVAVLVGLLASSYTAVLQGMRRIGDLGRVAVQGTLFGTAIGLCAVYLYGQAALVWFVVVQPLATFAVAKRYSNSLPKPTAAWPTAHEIWESWKPMVKLGAAFMLGGLATTATLLWVRSFIAQNLGLDAAGQFAAAWGVSITYVGFLLGAMAADYYPRLTEVINDRASATRLMNDQAQLGLAIGGPVLLLLIGMAPWLVTLLYSEKFSPAANLLQWQTVGNFFKLASWPLGYAFVSSARGGIFLFVQINFNFIFLLGIALGLKPFGLIAAGPAFMIAYILHFAVLNVLVHKICGFRWQKLSRSLLAMHASLALALLSLAHVAPLIAAFCSAFLALVTGLFGLRIVLNKVGPNGRLAARLFRFYALIRWPIENNC